MRTSSIRPADDRVERDAAVLRAAPLGDVHLRQHLEAGRDRVGQPLGDPLHLLENAVDAEADEQDILLRLDMDVAGAVFGRLVDDRVDEPDDRGVRDSVLGLEIILLVDDLELVVVDLRAGFGLAGPAEALQLREQLVLRRDAELEAQPRRHPQLVDARNIAGIDDRDPKHASLDLVRERPGPVEHGQRDLLDRVGRDLLVAEIDERHVVALCSRAGDALGRSQALVDDRLRQRAAPGPAARCGQAIRRDEPRGLEQVGDELGELVQVAPARRRGRTDGVGRCRGAARRRRGLRGLRGHVCRARVAHVPRTRYRLGLVIP